MKAFNIKQPFGPWAKDPRMKRIGAMQMLYNDSMFHSYGMAAFTRVLGMSSEEAVLIFTAAASAARNKNFHI